MKTMIVILEVPMDLWTFIDTCASDRAHHKDYSIEDMIQCKPQQDQILKWLQEIRENKLRYKR